MRKMYNAYYYSFEATGNVEVDRILEAVAAAGKAAHNTDQWNDENDWDGGVSLADKIQNAANESAKNLNKGV